MTTPTPTPPRIRIIPTEARYAPLMEALTDIVYGVPPGGDPGECFRAEHFRHHAAIFPEGQYIAVETAADGTERVIGLTSCMRIDFDPAHPIIEPWVETVSRGWLRRHTPDGPWLYGVESAVHPDYQGKGIGSRLYDQRFRLAKALNVRGMVAGGTLMDYCKAAHETDIEGYLAGVISGRYTDGNLTKQIQKGFRPIALIPNYVDDPCALGWGAVIVWDNPDYDPARGIVRELPPDFRHDPIEVTLKSRPAR